MFHPRFPGAAFAIVAAVGLLYPILVHAIARLADVPVQRATWLGGVSLALLAGFTLHVWRRRTIGADELQGVLSALTSRDLHSVDAAAKRLTASDGLSSGLKAALNERTKLLIDLRERGKEIDAFATAIQLCFREDLPDPAARLAALALRLPEFWLHPEHAIACIRYGGARFVSIGFKDSPWRQIAHFRTMDGIEGSIELAYTCELPELDEGPFLAEERVLIDKLASLLSGYLDSDIGHRNLDAADAALRELSDVMSETARGNFSRRMQHDGANSALNNVVNGLIETLDQNIGTVSRSMRSLAQGDLRNKVEGQFEGAFAALQGDINSTIMALRAMLGEIQAAAQAIDSAASEIAAGNADLSSRTEQQAAALEETAASMEELTSTVRGNAENARSANQWAIGAGDVAERGSRVVRQVVDTMGEIHGQSRKIEDIIGVIDGIAFQTNILALNAAVEAARAGEQGRGFAVVASEVRTLAQRSASAAREIKSLISETVERVDTGSRLVDAAGTTMAEILSAVTRVTNIMGEISAASAQQTSGIEQLSATVTHMDEATQQNAALVEEATAAARSLEDQAGRLAQNVGRFRL
ncbi:methyl-accepting chemotaxis protein [Silanimonas sp.]|uniref:methyl-accepting chemotaxis protein n=1 Tax=Silanimonas sp. TaxID=1929290 RepID=UPI0022C39A67|nr:methyl-accepting chemotaxis protein [Silanimonas sp.]MCZ8164833.1 methyl-accepting chemotaxis protein [Silanimonas sp.]